MGLRVTNHSMIVGTEVVQFDRCMEFECSPVRTMQDYGSRGVQVEARIYEKSKTIKAVMFKGYNTLPAVNDSVPEARF